MVGPLAPLHGTIRGLCCCLSVMIRRSVRNKKDHFLFRQGSSAWERQHDFAFLPWHQLWTVTFTSDQLHSERLGSKDMSSWSFLQRQGKIFEGLRSWKIYGMVKISKCLFRDFLNLRGHQNQHQNGTKNIWKSGIIVRNYQNVTL